MPHLPRPQLKARYPVHVTMRLRNGLPSLRHHTLSRLVLAAFRKVRAHLGVRLVQFSVQSNHLHLIVEALDQPALSRAMQGLAISVARRVNGKLGRRGAVFADRYHTHALRTPLEVRRALVYVLHNHRHHTARDRPSGFDPMSTALSFDGFTDKLNRLRGPPREELPVVPPRTWLLRIGWRRHGLLTSHDVPA
jgi:REP element-mobilizing transposase RayT